MDFDDFKEEFEAKGEKEVKKASSDPMGGVNLQLKWRCPRCGTWVKESIGKVCRSCKNIVN